MQIVLIFTELEMERFASNECFDQPSLNMYIYLFNLSIDSVFPIHFDKKKK